MASDPQPSRATPKKKEIRELLRRLPPGYSIAFTSNGAHPILFDADGHPVRLDGIPVAIPLSPSRNTSMRNTISRIRRAGIPVR